MFVEVFMFNDLRGEVAVLFIAFGDMVDLHCLYFHNHIVSSKINLISPLRDKGHRRSAYYALD